MRLVDDQLDYETNHIIINGNGTYPELPILKRICEIYDGGDKIIVFPRTPLKRKFGLSALTSIYSYLDYGFRNLIFIVDREHISEDINTVIKNRLSNINFLDEKHIQDAFLFKCKLGHRNFNLFCNISGLENCIEEEFLKLIELQMNIQINIPPVRRDASWRAQLKAEIDRHINRKEAKRLIGRTGRRKIEIAFPNLCAIFKEIERMYEI